MTNEYYLFKICIIINVLLYICSSNSMRQMEQNTIKKKCPVCWSKFYQKDMITFSCSKPPAVVHQFCKTCTNELKKNTSFCPICRQRVFNVPYYKAVWQKNKQLLCRQFLGYLFIIGGTEVLSSYNHYHEFRESKYIHYLSFNYNYTYELLPFVLGGCMLFNSSYGIYQEFLQRRKK